MPGASLAIVDRRRRVLLLRRTAAAGAGGRWNLPGGGQEPGETRLQTALNEAQEEAGFDLRPADLLVGAIEQSTYSTWVVRIGRRFRPRVNWESDAWVWMSPEQALADLDLIDPQRQVLARLGRMLS